jgi:RimJ/RimL family protein N-acetyltransferase
MTIKGGDINLRPIKIADAKRFVKWFSDSTVNKFLARRKLTLKEELAWIRKIPKNENGISRFAIETKDGVHIGSVSFHDINKNDKFATFGIMIGDKMFWNRGYGTEATKLILDHGFQKLKLHRIELEVYEYNPRAIKVYKRLGFKSEGKKRERVFLNGKFYDVLQMGILKNE